MKKYILLSLTATLLFGCEDFLNENPETFQTPQSFFVNERQFNEAVTAIYNTNRSLMNDEHWRFGENRSDNNFLSV